MHKDLNAMQPNKARADLMMDLLLVAFLIGFDVAARLLPHAYGFMPVAASGLFAARVLRMPALAVIVPIAAMLLSGVALGPDDWRVSLIVYAALAIPALAGMATRRWQGAAPVMATMIGSSLAFFVLSNAAVWAFSGLYPVTQQGLVECFVAALPFLDKTVMGDLFWCAVLFGGAWLVQHGPALARRPL
ncbi:MAG TPA: DUF6580 family putative transport protein [Pseudolabrys sp.]|jgi:hypothetical protein